MKQAPQYLYKYRSFSEYALKGLQSKEVWFSSADVLNDPFDSNCRIDTRVPLDDQREIRTQIFLFCNEMNKVKGYDDIIHLSNDSSLPDDLKFAWSCKEFARFAFQSSIYSLTEKPLHPLMWAHYCNSYSGFVVEYDTTRETSDFWFDGPRSVNYADQPPFVDIRELVDSEGVNYSKLEQFEDSVLFSKAAIWEYESEWRLVAREHRTGAQVQPYDISRIIFGYRMPKQQRKELVNIFGEKVKYEVAVPDLLSYSLSLMDIEREEAYLRDLDRSLRTVTYRTEFIGTGEFRRHDT